MSDNRDTYTVKAPHGTSADSIRTIMMTDAAMLEDHVSTDASADWSVTVHSVAKGAPAPGRKRKSDRRVIIREEDPGNGGFTYPSVEESALDEGFGAPSYGE
jgi:hypothetical protein